METGSAFRGRGRGGRERAARAAGAGTAGELLAQGGQVPRPGIPAGASPGPGEGHSGKGWGRGLSGQEGEWVLDAAAPRRRGRPRGQLRL